jgi:acetoin utilization deacetylase AcuC-like enzyme
LVHPADYHEKIREACLKNQVMAEINLNPDSYEAAKTAIGLTVMASERGDFAVVRPPGHHAGINTNSGFCLFNNIAIATQKLVNEGKRVLLIDFDAHHGNGTQEIFYQSNRVFFISFHQAFSFPHTGQPGETGTGEGKGFSQNVPLMPGSDDKTLLAAFDKAIVAGREFNPDVVGVSAGFDGYYKDKMMNFNFTLKGYYECGFKIARAFKRVFAVLEGGYHDDIYPCVINFIEGVNVGSRPIKSTFNPDMSIG